MTKIRWKRQVYLAWVALFLVSIACRIEPPKLVLEETSTPAPTFVVTQVITEIVTPTPVPVLPTSELQGTEGPTPTSTWDPVNAPVYYPLPNCVASRLYRGDKAMVSLVGGPNAVRYDPDLHNSGIAYYAQPGEILTNVDGPWCSYGWLIWLVETKNGFRGYTPEGDGNEYWLFPVR